MVTLLAVYNSEGCQGRCDAKCYGATHPDCDCICSGRNHGAGLQQATDNTRALAESWIDRARKAGQDITGFELATEAAHEPLFTIGETS